MNYSEDLSPSQEKEKRPNFNTFFLEDVQDFEGGTFFVDAPSLSTTRPQHPRCQSVHSCYQWVRR